MEVCRWTGPATFSMCTSPKISPFSVTLPLTSEKVRSLQWPSAVMSPLDLVGGEVVLVVGEVHLHRAGDGAEMDVAVGGGDVDARAQPGRGHVALAGVDGDPRGFGHGDGQVQRARCCCRPT